jgi:hypothetical protein
MSRPSGIIGAQAVAVAVLVLIVYMTLLRPESDEPLRGISTPGQERVHVPGETPEGKPGRDRERKADGHQRGRVDGGGIGEQTEVRRTGAGSMGGPPLDRVVTPSGVPPLNRVVTPSGDQYADAVASLLGKVASAVPPGAG